MGSLILGKILKIRNFALRFHKAKVRNGESTCFGTMNFICWDDFQNILVTEELLT